jgi:predicted nuclease of restriction endonuclease-like RecB superfamily
MLTSDLLVTKISKGKIEPVYALVDQDNLEIARSVIGVFQEHLGRTYSELIEELEGIEEINYRLIRGLAQILERRCVIETDSVIDPIAARRTVFEESRGFVTSEKERKMVLDKVAKKLSIESDGLEKALWADHEGNLVIREFQTLAPLDLLRRLGQHGEVATHALDEPRIGGDNFSGTFADSDNAIVDEIRSRALYRAR